MDHLNRMEQQAASAVLRDLVDLILDEDLFGLSGRCTAEPQMEAILPDLEVGEQRIVVALSPSSGKLVFRARWDPVCRQYRLSRSPVLGVFPDRAQRALDPVALLDALVEAFGAVFPNLEGFRKDLEDAVTLTGLSWATADRITARVHSGPSSLLDWEQLAALRDRPFHPSARARTGWTPDAYRRFSPEFPEPFGLVWLAVQRDYIRNGGTISDEEIPALLLSSSERQQLSAARAAHGIDPEKYCVLPVHPWQMEHVLPGLYMREFRDGICIPIARDLGCFRATSSVRSLASDSGPTHLKLPLGIYSLGALRVMPPRYLHNGAEAERTLRQVRILDPILAHRLRLCRESSWWAFNDPEDDPFTDKPGHLACLLREYPTSVQNGRVQLMPMSALGVLTPDGAAPAAERLLRERGGTSAAEDVLELFREVSERLVEVALACFGHGVMPELHGQNTVLILHSGRVAGILLRDHDTLRIYPEWMAQSGLSIPDYEVKPNSPNTLILDSPETLLAYFQTLAVQVNLRAIAETLAERYRIEVTRFWAVLGDVFVHCGAAPSVPPAVRKLWRDLLLERDTWPTKLVLKPLLERNGTGGGSMPSALATRANPFHSLSRIGGRDARR